MTRQRSSDYQLLSGLFFRLLPYQVLLIVISAVNGIVDSLYASNVIENGTAAMSAIGLFGPLNHFLYAAVILAGAWITLKRFPRTLEDLMAIPGAFGAKEDERIDISVRNMDEVMNVSRQVIAFCEQRWIDQRRSFLAGLCMEEMAGNIVTHGFSKDRKKHSVDIRVIHIRNELILRIRDNCAAFNPTEYARIMEAGELGKNVGIRLVYGMAGDVSYQNLLGMNVLTMRI